MDSGFGGDIPSFLSEPTEPEPVEDDRYMRRVGWVTFAAVMLVLVGFLNVIYGFAAIGDANFYADDARFVIGDLNTWGWVHIGLGGLAMIAAFLIIWGSRLGRGLGMVIVGLNAITQLLAIEAYPFVAMSVFALDILVLYGLAAHGGVEPVPD